MTTLGDVAYPARMNISEVAMAAAITVSITGVSYAAFNTGALTDRAKAVAAAATCRAVDEGIVAYVAGRDANPVTINDLAPYVSGDLSAFRIVNGRAAGP